jgi:predicted transcriptional regulator
MFFSKYIVLLCLYEELEKNKQINPKEIINKFEINNRQMWSYIKNLKEYYFTQKNQELSYDVNSKIRVTKKAHKIVTNYGNYYIG